MQSSNLAGRVAGQTFFVFRWPRLILGLLFLVQPAARGADLPISETNLIPANVSLWTESMLWDQQFSISSGVGYKDNVLLSEFHPRGSGYFINGLDYVLLRLPLDGWQVEGSLVGDDIRYWRAVGTTSEDSFIGNLKVQRELPDGWKAGIEVIGAYEKQVLDISPAPGVPATTLVVGESLTVKPSLRRDLGLHWWLQWEMPVTRWWLAAPLDDDWEFGPVLTAGRHFGVHSDVTLGYGVSYEDHNAWTTANFMGQPTAPLHKLQIFQNRVELAWHQYWDAHQRWRSSTQLVYADLVDNGGGYYNEHQYQVIQDLRWQTAGWMIKGSADITYEDYPIQWVGASNGHTLHRDLWEFSFEMERRLYGGLRAFAKVEYQRALSNEDLQADDYHATTISAGLRYEF